MASDSVSNHHASEKGSRITVDSLLQAMEVLKEPKGSSLSSLKKYFCSSLPDHISSNEISVQIKKAIARGIRERKITKQGKSNFLLGLDDIDEGSRKRRRRNLDEDERPHRRRRRRSSRRRRRGGKRRRRRSRRRRRYSRRRKGRKRGGRRRRYRRRRR